MSERYKNLTLPQKGLQLRMDTNHALADPMARLLPKHVSDLIRDMAQLVAEMTNEIDTLKGNANGKSI